MKTAIIALSIVVATLATGVILGSQVAEMARPLNKIFSGAK